MAQLGLEVLCCLPSNDLGFTGNLKRIKSGDLRLQTTFFSILLGLNKCWTGLNYEKLKHAC